MIVGVICRPNGNVDFASHLPAQNAMLLSESSLMSCTRATQMNWQPQNSSRKIQSNALAADLVSLRLRDATKCGARNAELHSPGERV